MSAVEDDGPLFPVRGYVSMCPSLQRELNRLLRSGWAAKSLWLLEDFAGLSEEEYLKRKAADNE